MKTLKPLLAISIFILIFSNVKLLRAQDWKWATTGTGTNHHTELLATDCFNNSYFAVYYNDSLTIGDQSYFHEQWPDQYNCVLLKLDKQGNILNQLDMYTQPAFMSSLYPMKMAADSLGNVYIAGSFAVRVFIGDTVINHLPVPDYQGPEAYLVKFNSSFDIVWAKVIGCEHYMYFQNMDMRNGRIYYAVDPNSWSSPDPITLYCFGQDTLYFPNSNDYSVQLYLDLNGQIESYHVMHGHSFWAEREVVSANKERFLIGIAGDTVFDGNVPVYIPSVVTDYDQYFLQYDINNSLIGTSFVKTNNNLYLNISAANSDNELFFSVITSDDLIIGDVTIPINYVNTCVFGKLNAQRQLAWYETLVGINLATFTPLRMTQQNDTLYIAFDYSFQVYFSDTILYHKNGIADNLIASYTSDGERIQFFETNTTRDSHLTGFGFDNCGNMLIAGTFQGTGYYGKDTIVAHYNSGDISDLFVAYLDWSHLSLELGPDTTVCNTIVLKGLDGWDHYNWNNGQSLEQVLPVTESGQYKLTMWNTSCCWLEDSVSVTVLPKPEISLGNDTVLKQSHSLELKIPDGYLKYYWSTGDTLSTILLNGSEFTPGYHVIWCEVSDNNCSAIDSLIIDVIDDKGIPEYPEIHINVSPNPFVESFRITAEKPIQSIEILDYSGKVLALYLINQRMVQPVTITPEDMHNRIIILRIKADNKYYYRKVIQMD
jgi:hypothetical protein